MRLTVLEQSPAAAGRSHTETIQQTLDLAERCEGLGYERFWVAEHHNSESIVGTAPEIMVAAVAARTRTIRVGSAGVLLPHYAPFKVAEQFRTLQAIAPGRIDLGIGRSPGGGANAAMNRALRPGAGAPEPHDEEVRRLLTWLYDDAGDGLDGVRAYPRGEGDPEVWMLNNSANGARLAAELGLPLAFNYSNDILPDGVDGPLEIYRRNYRPSRRHPEPYLALLAWTLAADDRITAHHLFSTRALWRIGLDRGERRPMEAPETAAAHPFTEIERARIEGMLERYFVGAADEVAERLAGVAKQHQAQELVISTWTYDPGARLRSYELVADALLGSPIVNLRPAGLRRLG